MNPCRPGRITPRIIVGLSLAGALAACGLGATPGGTPSTFPPRTFGPGTSLSPDGAVTVGTVEEALRAAGLRVFEPRVPYRPAEARRLYAAPRRVIQVQLANPRQGYISIYEFGDAAAARAAAEEQAGYVASGPGRIQFPADSRFVLRQAGRTVVFYAWSPAAAEDDDAGRVADALATVGSEVSIPG